MSTFKLSCTLSGHEQDIRDVIAPSDDMIISGSRDATVRIWNRINRDKGWSTSSSTESLVAFHSPVNEFINAVTYIDNETEPLIAGAGKDCVIYLSEVASSLRKPGDDFGKCQLVGHEANVCSLFYQDQYIISGSWDATAKVWDLNSLSVKYDLRGHESSVWDARIIDDNTFLTCSADKTIRKWVGNHEVARFTGHSDVVRKLLILPGGEQFASCSNDCTIKIWDLNSGQLLETLEGHESFVYDIDILPNGDLVSSGEDRTVRVWRNYKVIQAITLPCISVWCLSVLPSGDVVAGGSDNKLRVFTRDPERVAPAAELKEFKESVQQSSIAEQSLDDLKKTDIPGYEALQQPGKEEGSTIMVKNPSGTIEAHQWSSGEWIKIGDVVGSAGTSGRKQEFNGKKWDYLFDVDIEDGAPPLKLPYNINENPYVAAQRFLADNDLPGSYADEVVRFIMKNTGGIQLDERSQPVENPYADHHPTTSNSNVEDYAKLKIIPEKSYIYFKDFKADQIINGLAKFNEQQVDSNKFSSDEINRVSSILNSLKSKQALEIITVYIPKILNVWEEKNRLIGYDLLRISIPRVTTVDLLRSTDAAQVILDAIKSGLNIVNESSLPLFMMLLKTVNNLIGNTLFVQLYINPSVDGKYEFNEIFEELLTKVADLLEKISSSAAAKQSKHYNSTVTTAATLIYNLSVYHLRTSLLNSNPYSAKPIVVFANQIGEILVQSNTEAAYRLIIGYGNYKYSKSYNESPKWLLTAKNLYIINNNNTEKRFIDLAADIENL